MALSGRGRRPPSSGSRIHAGLVGERELIGTPYLADHGLRAEYEREIAPRTVAALTKVLAEVFPDPVGGRPGTVLDLGAGTGAVAEVVRAVFGAHQSIIEVDQVARGGTTRTADVTHVDSLVAFGAPFDLVIAAHVLNELYVGEEATLRGLRLARLVRAWCEELLGDAGTLILVEPALRETSRALLTVRDHLLAAGLHIVAPCFFTGPCPALLRDRDWCHDSADTAERRVDFSYLVVRTTGQAAVDPNCFRIVSDPLPEKGRLRLFGCGVSGRHPLVRLDRHVSERNADLDRLARGDVAHVARTTFAGDGLRVGTDTTVVRVTAASPLAPCLDD
ncbi:MAG TPA: small ribosomal subunit Rsm22 family protein, partial [Polyangia bacterium]